MRELFYDRCVHTGNTELLGQWDERNAPLTPKTVSYGSKKKLWWHCRKGHSWQAAVYNRSAGSGCPYCAGKAVESGGNDLASVYPELAKQWDAVKNAPLTPADVTPHTHRKVWWKCAQGHEWQASVHSRAQGTGCPICTNHIPVVGENTLADRFPQVAQEWDYEKNAPLTPEQVLPGTSRRVWWICPNGHSYRSARSGKWQAQITFKRKTYYLGSFDKLEDAVKARKRGEEMHDVFLEWYYTEHKNSPSVSN